MPDMCVSCHFPLTPAERAKYRNRCRWCGAPEWRQESERTALAALAGSPESALYAPADPAEYATAVG